MATKLSNVVVLDKATQRLQALEELVKNAKTEENLNQRRAAQARRCRRNLPDQP